ncbi:MAG: endolytic transglycosylase MltG [Desulfovibrio sp.]|nr:MAG: endolytic transglycosylase MltG [Desulfovibrio sp.]
MRKLIFFVVFLFVIGILSVAAFVVNEARTFMSTPPETPGRDVTVIIEPGMTFDQIAAMLKEEGIITNAQYFRFLGKWEEKLSALQAGEFTLNTGWTPDKVLDYLVEGQPTLYRLSIREGLTWWETARVVEESGQAGYEEFVEAIFDPELLEKYNIPSDSPEGFLFPETYLLPRPGEKDARFIAELLFQSFWDHAEEVWPEGPPDSDEIWRIVILASLVEKETGAADERARIAGVYAKRMEIGMLLQCDPTIIYGLGEEFDGNIRRRDLENPDNPYNTYVHGGLPPGPICSSGLDALRAAVDPEEHDYLYFVSRGDGTHQFSTNLRDHNNAVNQYQR